MIIGDRVADRLPELAVGWRSGTVASCGPVPTTPADAPIRQWSATAGPVDDRSPAGGAGRDDRTARDAAIGELLERYAAARFPLPVRDRDDLADADHCLRHDDFTLHARSQRQADRFPYADSYRRREVTRVHSLATNRPVWVPANLVSNDPGFGHLATSNGLAAGPTTMVALLRAAQELVERDAFMISWLHQLSAPTVPVTAEVAAVADPIGARVRLLDLTPVYSPHPVAAVAGTALLAGRPRNSIGLACRSTFTEAAAKAALEWAQGVAFAGVNTATDPAGLRPAPAEVTDFDRHALFYTRRPELWDGLPLWSAAASPASSGPVPRDGRRAGSPEERPVRDQLRDLVGALADHGIELLYRDLTLPDVVACGVRVVRVLSPQLTPIHPDHRWPHLGGSTADLARRYPDATSTGFPSPHPHPLG